MKRFRRSSSRHLLWLFALALLLRAAMPVLADASAELQGRAIAEVCSVYGVAVVPHDTQRHDAPGTEHTADDCALTALGSLGTAAAPPEAAWRTPVAVAKPAPAFVPWHRPDATAAWVARRKQGPPALA